jgi:hypothetical protein
MWFDYMIELAEEFKCPIAEGCCNPGNTKYVLFRNCKRAFEKNINNIVSIELRSSSDEEPFTRTDEMFLSDIDNEYKTARIGIYEVFLNDELRLAIGTNLCNLVNPKYAFLYKFPFVFSPWTYAANGISNTEYDDTPGMKYYNEKHVDIVKRISSWHWCDNTQIICELGFLREIYPINFINENHLNHEVFSRITLKDWIEAADHRGTLKKITDDLWSWIIPEEDLYQVTVDLAPSDILLCVNKDNPQRYDYGVRPEDQITVPVESPLHR